MFGSTALTTPSSVHQAEYDHTQWAPMYWLLLAPALILLFVSALLVGDTAITLGLTVVAVVLLTMAYSFRSLRIVDEGDKLALHFGPLPFFKKRFAYANILTADRDRTSTIDGLGMHWVPGRGWTYNLWGFDCVRLELTRGRTVRVGTNDPEGLERFLKDKCRR